MVAVQSGPVAGRFLWVSSGEPHAIRRRELLAKYGDQIRKLYGYDHATAWQVVTVVACQFIMAALVRDWAWWKLAVAAYVVSGTLNQNLFCAQHEISHFLAFKKPLYNKVLALVGNMPLVVPVAVKFREYHHDHHIFLGVDGGDVDLPTVLESSWIAGFFSKLFFTFIYLAIYAVRPLIVRPKAITAADFVNWGLVIGTDVGVLYFLGIKSLVYLLAGSLLGGGLHPMAGHLIAEHYMFSRGQETYSYYGPLNLLSYNVGYHNEHHDFPQIPQTRLHKLRQIAPEYYNNLYAHTSWCWVLWRFLVDPAMGPWSRMHRVMREGTPAANDKFIGSMCKTAAETGAWEAARSAEVLDKGGASALQAAMGGKSAGRLIRKANSENEPQN
ncbi:hypothetical protein CHLNCDRAFT_57665 [Chlorella variabilis]|uniref:Sphingolipid delta4-desaturase N-terminal domain-containing protein n=1 Tax=Chlorella variabilis TaxID=554065 RepID=E1ZCJ5_CHLVA|nr:hypothetical protein CHLNCDRAFT_57665 [Chlorella variabilis]EFN56445.1 hypothetical protein CHLNCDRAFT_57665 [Chlorella variabilis]|eukprot:XP_005848547.1 hypothetical protein CHLNCDRAFT_57665 [Chlorella variabilis]